MAVLRAIALASSQISVEYFLLPIACQNDPIKRERVYCYELYHQLRLALRDLPLTLTGEPDKRGHSDFTGKQPNPDFILHTPGHHGNNTAVIEVECRLGKAHLIKDLKTLKLMKEKGYHLLVLLFFAADEIPWKRLEKAATEVEISLSEIAVLLHRAAGKQATQEYPPNRNAA